MNGRSQSSSSNLDYSLGDEEPRRGGAGKISLILLALALVAGFGYLRWNWLIGTSKRPAVAPQTPDPPATTYVLPSSSDTSPPPNPAPGGYASSPKTHATAPSDASNSSRAEPQANPHAGIMPLRSADSVAEAQKYIYGRGVAQDCERGMRLLKPAAQANPQAMMEMGTLYAAGLCAPRDLPTAYRWFSVALRKEPDNQSGQAELQKLWGEMTPPERQLATRLSQ
jgi:hypothetical protein